MNDEPTLRLRNIHKNFESNTVLRGIDLDVQQGDVVALIGASGSGKSTLLRCINLLEQLDDGQIWLSGQEISTPQIDQDSIRSRIGVVFQALNLFPHLSVLDNVTLASRTVLKKNKKESQDVGMALLEKVGLAEKALEYPDRLSGGQQQRVALVRAIATNPDLLLLDEITSALDPLLVGEVLDLVRNLAQDGTTIVMATHEMEFAREVADRVVFLDAGVVCESGSAIEVFDSPREKKTQEFLTRFRGNLR
ncbi:MAG: amino acid ABC transporter ATP-binding protein [Pontimonas sp.]